MRTVCVRMCVCLIEVRICGVPRSKHMFFVVVVGVHVFWVHHFNGNYNFKWCKILVKWWNSIVQLNLNTFRINSMRIQLNTKFSLLWKRNFLSNLFIHWLKWRVGNSFELIRINRDSRSLRKNRNRMDLSVLFIEISSKVHAPVSNRVG